MSLKQRAHEILEKSNRGDSASALFDGLIMTLIVLNTAVIILETVGSLGSYRAYFFAFDVFSVVVFTIEYGMRVWSITAERKYRRPIIGRIKYIFTPLAIVDLLAILPFYLPFLIPFDLRFLRLARVLRLFMLFKMARYLESLKRFGRVFKDRKEELVITLFLILFLLVISSSLVFFVEHDAQPESFSSIPAAMWWGVATLTTVGYGDIVPVTALGKFFGAIIALLGIGLFVLPAGILSAGFASELMKIRKKKGASVICPHCGGPVDLGK
jgi:voltage-gated potassium channel